TMCSGHSIRVSQGGTIAVLRPIRSLSEEHMLLLFRNHFSKPGTSVELQGRIEEEVQDIRWVVIHRDGDLTASTSKVSDPLYSFPLIVRLGVSDLPQRLYLGVGDDGIIGRRVSIMTGATHAPLTIAQGIIGWN
ncbi:hypothetical protein T440DRAFT_409014, partial [Plenodomus tracheiphilus IPT5]